MKNLWYFTFIRLGLDVVEFITFLESKAVSAINQIL